MKFYTAVVTATVAATSFVVDAVPRSSRILERRFDDHAPPTPPPSYEEKYFTQTLDHFRFRGTPRATFQHRYLVNDDHWGEKISTEGQDPSGNSGCKGPILFYTGELMDGWTGIV